MRSFAKSRLIEALDKFNTSNYFEAHEILEDIWFDVHDETKQVYQGLLHYATALHHLTAKKNPKGALLQLDKALKKLGDSNIKLPGLDIKKILREINSLNEKIKKGEAVKRLPLIKIK